LRLVRESAIPTISIVHTIDERLRTPLGGLIENVILLQLLEGTGGLTFISGWKKNHKEPIEVDFVVKAEGIPLPIEVKATLNANERHCKNIVHYCKLFDLRRGVLFSLDIRKNFKIDDIEIDVLPVYLAESKL
jgi:predicted AAA+ superfamily ATPase